MKKTGKRIWGGSAPYGMRTDGTADCINAEPGTFSHECNAPAEWIGTKENGFEACFCDACKGGGWEARKMASWRRIDQSEAA
ncbi:MAG: hypothetical protein RIC87_12535 [Kiloniellales bacterium]